MRQPDDRQALVFYYSFFSVFSALVANKGVGLH